MRICFVCPRLCHGGAERVAVTLANGFVSKGYEVMFFTDLNEEQSYILDDSVKLYNLVSSSTSSIRKWGSAIRNLRKAFVKEHPAVVIGIMSTCSLIARIAAVGTKCTVIATEHDSFEKPMSSPMPLWDKFYKFHVSKIFKCMSVLTEADMRVLGEKRKNVVVMPNPLAISPIDEIFEKKRIILAAGRVDNWRTKGFDLLIRAWADVVHNLQSTIRNEGWKLQIAGAWREAKTRKYLDDIAKECGIADSVEFLGFVNDMKSKYKESSIFVMSGRKEGFGLVLIEAMSQGCACVACDYKGRQREIIQDDSQGLCCAPDDVEALAEGISRMIEDVDYRKEVQKKSVERSEAYSVDLIIQRWENLFCRIIN